MAIVHYETRPLEFTPPEVVREFYAKKPAAGQRSLFDEDEHPRDEAGKFSEKSESGLATQSENVRLDESTKEAPAVEKHPGAGQEPVKEIPAMSNVSETVKSVKLPKKIDPTKPRLVIDELSKDKRTASRRVLHSPPAVGDEMEMQVAANSLQSAALRGIAKVKVTKVTPVQEGSHKVIEIDYDLLSYAPRQLEVGDAVRVPAVMLGDKDGVPIFSQKVGDEVEYRGQKARIVGFKLVEVEVDPGYQSPVEAWQAIAKIVK